MAKMTPEQLEKRKRQLKEARHHEKWAGWHRADAHGHLNTAVKYEASGKAGSDYYRDLAESTLTHAAGLEASANAHKRKAEELRARRGNPSGGGLSLLGLALGAALGAAALHFTMHRRP
jgi:hypothetical protein